MMRKMTPGNMKKNHIRILAVVAEATKDGGVSAEQAASLMKTINGKDCMTVVAVEILDHLNHQGLTRLDQQGLWVCNESGLTLYNDIKKSRPDALEKSTSPSVPMHTGLNLYDDIRKIQMARLELATNPNVHTHP